MQLRDVTLVFLVKKQVGKIEEICLAMKKRGFGVGRWNGVGGKLETGETVLQAAVRETREEIEINVSEEDLKKVAELDFYFPHNALWNQKVHVFFVEKWNGYPEESEEMKPEWFLVENIPFYSMWPDDIFWLPQVLCGDIVSGKFVLGENDIILEKEVAGADFAT